MGSMLAIPPTFKPYALVLLVLVVVAAIALVVVTTIRGGDLSDPHVSTLLGYALTIAAILIAGLGLSSQVAAVHTSINGRMTELVDSTAAASFQAGQIAPEGTPVPPAPSTVAPSVPVNPSPKP
jgi:hypothetical protein